MAESEPKRRKLQSRKTRSNSDHFLIGASSESISHTCLPTLRQVLQYLLYQRESSSKPTKNKDSINHTVEEVIAIWQMARIPIKQKHNVAKMLGQAYDTWLGLKKNAGRTNDPGGKRQIFCNQLDKLWDIGLQNAIFLIENDPQLTPSMKSDDIAFYQDQQRSRNARMAGKDKIFEKSISMILGESSTNQLDNVSPSTSSSDEFVKLASSSSEDESSTPPSEYEPGIEPISSFVLLKVPRNLMEHKHVTATLDRSKVTDNQATMIFSAFIKACGGNVNDFILSRSSTKRCREINRLEISHQIFEAFQQDLPQQAALHWDGKLTTNRLGNNYEALAVIVSCHPQYPNGKLLGIQKIDNATGKAQAESTYNLLKKWNLQKSISALVFDTTSSNSGWNKGAAKILEDLLGKKMLYHACRHHTLELVVKEVWKCLFGHATTGPENTMFNTFKRKWSQIDKSRTVRILTVPEHYTERASKIISYLKMVFSKKDFFTRDDYKLCVINTLTLLGAEHRATHQRPGATHHARWMATILYAQNMFMWAEQMEYSETLIKLLERMNLFLALFYVPAWVDSSIGRDAPGNDLRFICDMHHFKIHDIQIAEAALKKLMKHPWYIVEECVIYSLFSPKESNDTRKTIAKKLLNTEKPSAFRLGPPSLSHDVSYNTALADLVGPQSWHLFKELKCDGEWLNLPVEQWDQSVAYQRMESFISSVKVVNDAAERGVKLNTDYASIITDDEIQKQSLMQAVEQHRQTYPDFRKSTLSQ